MRLDNSNFLFDPDKEIEQARAQALHESLAKARAQMRARANRGPRGDYDVGRMGGDRWNHHSSSDPRQE